MLTFTLGNWAIHQMTGSQQSANTNYYSLIFSSYPYHLVTLPFKTTIVDIKWSEANTDSPITYCPHLSGVYMKVYNNSIFT